MNLNRELNDKRERPILIRWSRDFTLVLFEKSSHSKQFSESKNGTKSKERAPAWSWNELTSTNGGCSRSFILGDIGGAAELGFSSGANSNLSLSFIRGEWTIGGGQIMIGVSGMTTIGGSGVRLSEDSKWTSTSLLSISANCRLRGGKRRVTDPLPR